MVPPSGLKASSVARPPARILVSPSGLEGVAAVKPVIAMARSAAVRFTTRQEKPSPVAAQSIESVVPVLALTSLPLCAASVSAVALAVPSTGRRRAVNWLST